MRWKTLSLNAMSYGNRPWGKSLEDCSSSLSTFSRICPHTKGLILGVPPPSPHSRFLPVCPWWYKLPDCGADPGYTDSYSVSGGCPRTRHGRSHGLALGAILRRVHLRGVGRAWCTSTPESLSQCPIKSRWTLGDRWCLDKDIRRAKCSGE